MSNLNGLILTAANYKITFKFANSMIYVLQTALSFDTSTEKQQEYIKAIGTTKSIGNKANSVTHSGSFEIQAGELALFYLAAGVTSDATDIEGATLTIVGLTVGTAPFVKQFTGVVINSENISVKAGDKDSKASFKWTAIDLEIPIS